jgi:hypothetical protein
LEENGKKKGGATTTGIKQQIAFSFLVGKDIPRRGLQR